MYKYFLDIIRLIDKKESYGILKGPQLKKRVKKRTVLIMALIRCPNCGKEISDRAKVCPGCNYVLAEEKTEPETPKAEKLCEECGTVLPEDAQACPNCGCPVTTEEVPPEEAQNVKITGVTIPKLAQQSKKKVLAIVGAAAVVLFLIIGIAVVAGQNADAEYGKNLNLAMQTMLTGAVEAEDAGNLIKNVWHDAIYDDYDAETFKYTSGTSDFNDALRNLFADPTFIVQISSIESNQETVQSQMKKLDDPPEEYEDAYDALMDCYDAYLDLTNLVTDPSGSLTTFSSNFNDADSEVANLIDKVKLHLG